jgi:hypothetical protein
MQPVKIHDSDPHELGTTVSPDSDLARLVLAQGVRPVEHFEDMLGGWPASETTDGFEEAVWSWREVERRSQLG